MARKSSLTDAQKQEILKRHVQGETPYAIGKAMSIPESTIRRNIGASATIKSAANQILAAEKEISSLSIPAQIVAFDVIAGLRQISNNMVRAAMIGSGNAVRLHSMAEQQLDKATEDPENPDLEAVKVAAGLTRAANDSAQTGLALMNANKGQEIEPPKKAKPLSDFYKGN